MRKYLESILRDDDVERTIDIKIYNSSLYLFTYIKKLVKDISTLGKQKIMLELAKIIQGILMEYSGELLKQIQREEKSKGKNE